ncbi:MAG: sugar phosphate nucleotidyltransferase [Pseudomonadota bacterium]
MIAVIMAGGVGSRLRPLTSYSPKPMLPILNKPIMEYVLHPLVRAKITRAMVTLYYRPNDIRDYFTDGSDWDIDLKYSLEKQPLGTAGSVKLALSKLKVNEPICIISGDGLTDFDLGKAFEEHKRKKADVSILLKKVENPLEYGVVVTDEDGWIDKFMEKPGRGQVVSDLVNTGIYIIEPDIISKIPDDVEYDFAKDLFPKLLKAKTKMLGITMDGYWADIGDLKQYVQTQCDILEGKVKLRIPGRKLAPGVWVGEHVELSGEEVLRSPVFVGENCRLGKDCKIGPHAIIGDNVVVDPRASVQHSVIMSNCFLGEGVQVDGSILGRNVIAETGSSIYEGAVVSDNCLLGQHSTIQAGVFIWPDKRVEAEAVVTNDMVWSTSHQAQVFAGNVVKGLANIRITPQFVMRLAMAFGAVLGRNKLVVVSRDGSRASRLMNRVLTSGLMAMGVNVIDLYGMPASICSYAVRSLGANGACHVRIGDEHSEMIQMEFFDSNGYPLGRDIQRKIEAFYTRGDFPRVKVEDVGLMHYRPGFISNYVAEALRHIDRDLIASKNFSVVIDYAYGTTWQIIPHLLEPIGCELITLRPYTEGGPRRVANSEAALERLVRMTRLNADLGVLMSPNGDSFSLVDELGNVHSPEMVRLLLVNRKLAVSRDSIVVPVNWSDAYPVLIQRSGGKVVPAKADWGDIIRTAAGEIDTPGEWVTFHHFYHEIDASFAFMKILELIASTKMPLSKLVAELPSVRIYTVRVSCPWEKMGTVLRRFAESYPPTQVETHDGIKIRTAEAWCLVLPDASSPKLIISAEGTTDDKRDRMLTSCREQIEKMIAEEAG